jgi:hypothetical protein
MKHEHAEYRSLNSETTKSAEGDYDHEAEVNHPLKITNIYEIPVEASLLSPNIRV